MDLIEVFHKLVSTRDGKIRLDWEKSTLANQLIWTIKSAVLVRLDSDSMSDVIVAMAKVIVIPQVNERTEDEIRRINKTSDNVWWRRKIIEWAVSQIIKDLKKK